MILTELEIAVIANCIACMISCEGQLPGESWEKDNWWTSEHWEVWPEEWQGKAECPERDECIQKLKRLGLIT